MPASASTVLGRRTIFTDEHDLFRAAFRQFVDTEIVPHADRLEREGIVDRELFTKAGASGFLCTDVPEAYGGGGVADFRYNLIIGEEVRKVSRRINALEEYLLPRLRDEVRNIYRVLDEREREDTFRLKRIKKKKSDDKKTAPKDAAGEVRAGAWGAGG